MAKAKNTKKTKKDRSIQLSKRHDNTYDIHISKHPLKTTAGKIVIWVILAGFVILPIIALIMGVASWISNL